MKILVNETVPGTANRAVELLASAGHSVLRCHEPGEMVFPCAALRPGRTCPLDEPGVDVAVTVRADPRSRPSPLEDGISCALRARVPVVVAGATRSNPYQRYGAETVEGEDVVGPCERVAIAPSPEHSRVATEGLRSALESAEGSGVAIVSRQRSGLRVSIVTDDSVDPAATKAAVPRVLAALREYDRHAPRIDVTLEP